jgi:hypothetical protein
MLMARIRQIGLAEKDRACRPKFAIMVVSCGGLSLVLRSGAPAVAHTTCHSYLDRERNA